MSDSVSVLPTKSLPSMTLSAMCCSLGFDATFALVRLLEWYCFLMRTICATIDSTRIITQVITTAAMLTYVARKNLCNKAKPANVAISSAHVVVLTTIKLFNISLMARVR